MLRRGVITSLGLIGGFVGFLFLLSTPAFATSWTDWTAAMNGAPGAATGTLGGVAVSYSGEVDGSV